METYFNMDHARRAYVTPCPNLATESQGIQNHVISEKKTIHVPVDIFVKKAKGKLKT